MSATKCDIHGHRFAASNLLQCTRCDFLVLTLQEVDFPAMDWCVGRTESGRQCSRYASVVRNWTGYCDDHDPAKAEGKA